MTPKEKIQRVVTAIVAISIIIALCMKRETAVILNSGKVEC